MKIIQRSRAIYKQRKEINRVFQNPEKSWLIHYACEAFDKPNQVPRISCICLKNVMSGEINSFSLHLIADEKNIDWQGISDKQLEDLEITMLSRFSTFISKREDHIWIHWKMKDACFGFEAISYRAKKLKTKGINIPNLKKINLFENIENIYTSTFITRKECSKGSLIYLAEKNHIDITNIIDGKKEAKLFENRDFSKIYRSVVAKVETMNKILEKTKNKDLIQDANIYQRIGVDFLNSRRILAAASIILSILVSIFWAAVEPKIQDFFGTSDKKEINIAQDSVNISFRK